MLEFLVFLTAKDKEIVDLVYKAKFSFEENTALCLLGKRYFGFTKNKQKRVVICTNNAMEIGGHFMPRSNIQDNSDRTYLYIRRVLRHEAVHVAQSCNEGKALNMFPKEKMRIHPYKENALKGSAKLSGKREKEIEAYWMEDKPRYVINALKKYC